MSEKKKILVIEEDIFLADLIASDLDECFAGSVIISKAYNWLETVNYLREVKFDLLILDFDIISSDNELELQQVFSFIHSLDLDYRILPVMAVDSEFRGKEDIFMRLGVELYLEKPWKTEDFCRIVTEICRF